MLFNPLCNDAAGNGSTTSVCIVPDIEPSPDRVGRVCNVTGPVPSNAQSCNTLVPNPVNLHLIYKLTELYSEHRRSSWNGNAGETCSIFALIGANTWVFSDSRKRSLERLQCNPRMPNKIVGRRSHFSPHPYARHLVLLHRQSSGETACIRGWSNRRL